MRLMFCGIVSVFLFLGVCKSDTAAAHSLSQTDLADTVMRLSELYNNNGAAETVAQMKAVRKKTGSSVIFSILDITGSAPGKILYHPTPFVTGHFIQQAKDADGRSHGHELVHKAQKTEPGVLFWVDYSVKSVSEGRVLRQMCCIRVSKSAVCGSMPSTGAAVP